MHLLFIIVLGYMLEIYYFIYKNIITIYINISKTILYKVWRCDIVPYVG